MDGSPPKPSGLYAGIGATRLTDESATAIRKLYAIHDYSTPLPLAADDAVKVFSTSANKWFPGDVVTAYPEKVQVKWKIGGREYVEEFSKKSERIQLPHGKSFKAASSFQESYEGWVYTTTEEGTGYFPASSRRGIGLLDYLKVRPKVQPICFRLTTSSDDL